MTIVHSQKKLPIYIILWSLQNVVQIGLLRKRLINSQTFKGLQKKLIN